MQLENFDSAAFLRDYWQKQPLLIRNPWTAWRNPLEPDELAGLACEAMLESRLVTQGSGGWALENGPFAPTRFESLGMRDWTLLVQAVDHHIPDVAALVAPFRFVPSWRIDDVMVSYAADGGSAGPHFDQYDVFLVQGLGRRRWQIGALCDETTALMPHDDLRLLADFEATEEWELESGDVLYVPPGIAHHGVALGSDCMTYSIGFRAPSRSELVAHFADHLFGEMAGDDRYADPDLQAQANSGEIAPTALAALRAMVIEALDDPAEFVRWFGQYVTEPKYPEIDYAPNVPFEADRVRTSLGEGRVLDRNPASRFSFVRGEGDALDLFVDGERFECAGACASLAEDICAQDQLVPDANLSESDAAIDLITALLNRGSLAFREDESD